MWNSIAPYLAALLPTIGLLVIFYVVFKTIFEADRRERRALAQWEQEQAARHGRVLRSTADDKPVSDEGD
jgi:hypothetical protein